MSHDRWPRFLASAFVTSLTPLDTSMAWAVVVPFLLISAHGFSTRAELREALVQPLGLSTNGGKQLQHIQC